MIKYVRTEYGRIIKITEKGCFKEFYNRRYAFVDKTQSHHSFNGYEVMKEADTIEELCDAFILKNPNNNVVRSSLEEIKNLQFYARPIYGGIWTNQGLIYVAKMNDKREFELI